MNRNRRRTIDVHSGDRHALLLATGLFHVWRIWPYERLTGKPLFSYTHSRTNLPATDNRFYGKKDSELSTPCARLLPPFPTRRRSAIFPPIVRLKGMFSRNLNRTAPRRFRCTACPPCSVARRTSVTYTPGQISLARPAGEVTGRVSPMWRFPCCRLRVRGFITRAVRVDRSPLRAAIHDDHGQSAARNPYGPIPPYRLPLPSTTAAPPPLPPLPDS